MLKLSLSKLENARINPSQVAQLLLQEEKKSGGSQGFLSTFKTHARNLHENDLVFADALKNLDHNLWVAFKDSPANKSRRTLYCDSFKNYAENFETLGLRIDTFQININWEIIPNAKLTGRSPFLGSQENNNVAYFFRENDKDWRSELKYPLLQIYLAETFFKCDTDKLRIGIYDISNMKFDFYCYEDFELDNAIEEGKTVFQKVLSEYNRYSR